MTNEFSVKLFELLNAQHIQYVVLRNWESLPWDLRGSDVDICVRRRDANAFKKVLNDVAEQTTSRCVSFIEDGAWYKICYLNKDGGIQLDILEDGIQYRGNCMISEDIIFSNSTTHNGVCVLNPTMANLTAYLIDLVYVGISKDNKYAHYLHNNRSMYSQTYLSNQLGLFSSYFVTSLYRAIKEDKLQIQEKTLAKIARKDITHRIHILHNIKKFLRPFKRPGYTIVFMGTDGSGKTTLIDELMPWLNEAFHNGVIYNHLRPNLLPDIAVLFGRREMKAGEICSSPHAKKPSGRALSVVKWCYYLIDYTIGYLYKIFPLISVRAKVIIFDRYYYDYYIDPKRARVQLPNWLVQIGEFFVPVPDLILCLGGSPNDIYSRKPETSLKEVEQQVRALKAFCMCHKNAIWIDTTCSKNESVCVAKNAVIDKLSIRFEDQLKLV